VSNLIILLRLIGFTHGGALHWLATATSAASVLAWPVVGSTRFAGGMTGAHRCAQHRTALLMEPTPPAENDRTHALKRVAEMGIAAIPVVGGPLQVSFQEAAGRKLAERREKWFAGLATRLADLEGRLGDFDHLADEEVFFDAVMRATRIADQTSRQEKIEALRIAVINSVAPGAPDADRQQLYFDLIDQLTPTHFRLLHLLNDPPGWFDDRPELTRPQFGMSSSRQTLIAHAMPDLGAQAREVVERYCGLLVSGELVNASFGGTMTAQGFWQAVTTNFRPRVRCNHRGAVQKGAT
jgi:hypothetical protein